MSDDRTTLVCLFHHSRQAGAALDELSRAGIPDSAITVIGNQPGGRKEDGAANASFHATTLEELGIPDRDLSHLREGVQDGGTVVAVFAAQDHVSAVEHVFERNLASVIDEAVVNTTAPATPAATDRSIPIVEEELLVGKRTVDRGGVRVFRRVIEIPAEESVVLHDEHVHVERRPTDRPVTEQDLLSQGDRTIELTETAEEAVIGKSAHVVEEIHVGKETLEHTEVVHETLRHTEVEIEQLDTAEAAGLRPSRSPEGEDVGSSYTAGSLEPDSYNTTRGGR